MSFSASGCRARSCAWSSSAGCSACRRLPRPTCAVCPLRSGRSSRHTRVVSTPPRGMSRDPWSSAPALQPRTMDTDGFPRDPGNDLLRILQGLGAGSGPHGDHRAPAEDRLDDRARARPLAPPLRPSASPHRGEARRGSLRLHPPDRPRARPVARSDIRGARGIDGRSIHVRGNWCRRSAPRRVADELPQQQLGGGRTLDGDGQERIRRRSAHAHVAAAVSLYRGLLPGFRR